MSPEFSTEPHTSSLAAFIRLGKDAYNALEEGDPERLIIGVEIPAEEGSDSPTLVEAEVVQTFPATIKVVKNDTPGAYSVNVKIRLIGDPEGSLQAGTLMSRVTQAASFREVTTFTPVEF